jgi:hypothetical protein
MRLISSSSMEDSSAAFTELHSMRFVYLMFALTQLNDSAVEKLLPRNPPKCPGMRPCGRY